jgi:hypothetical protein
MGLGDTYSLVETKKRKRVIIQNPNVPGDFLDAWESKTGKPTRVKRKGVRRVIKKEMSDYELSRYSWNR